MGQGSGVADGLDLGQNFVHIGVEDFNVSPDGSGIVLDVFGQIPMKPCENKAKLKRRDTLTATTC